MPHLWVLLGRSLLLSQKMPRNSKPLLQIVSEAHFIGKVLASASDCAWAFDAAVLVLFLETLRISCWCRLEIERHSSNFACKCVASVFYFACKRNASGLNSACISIFASFDFE